MIKRFNMWYDCIREPWRFVFFMGVIVLPITLSQIWIGAFAMVMLTLPLIGMRIWHLHGNKK